MKTIKRIVRAASRQVENANSRLNLWLVTDLSCGSNVHAQPGVRIRVTDGGKCRLGDRVNFNRRVDITVNGGTMEVGKNTYIGHYSVIAVKDKLSIGNDCLVAERVTIRDQDHRISPGKITADNGFVTAPVSIGNNVWIGANATITKGVTIGDNSVIGAGSVVTRDIPANVVAAGSPATIKRTLEGPIVD